MLLLFEALTLKNVVSWHKTNMFEAPVVRRKQGFVFRNICLFLCRHSFNRSMEIRMNGYTNPY